MAAIIVIWIISKLMLLTSLQKSNFPPYLFPNRILINVTGDLHWTKPMDGLFFVLIPFLISQQHLTLLILFLEIFSSLVFGTPYISGFLPTSEVSPSQPLCPLLLSSTSKSRRFPLVLVSCSFLPHQHSFLSL